MLILLKVDFPSGLSSFRPWNAVEIIKTMSSDSTGQLHFKAVPLVSEHLTSRRPVFSEIEMTAWLLFTQPYLRKTSWTEHFWQTKLVCPYFIFSGKVHSDWLKFDLPAVTSQKCRQEVRRWWSSCLLLFMLACSASHQVLISPCQGFVC